MGIAVRGVLAGVALCVLAACGGGGGGGGRTTGPGPNPGGTFTPGVFAPRANFAGQCMSPRPGTSDRSGSAFTEKMFLRSWTNELYLWYNEVPDENPNNIPDVLDYFDSLRTPQTTPSGNDKDRFHFFIDTEVWRALSQSGQSIGYGAEWVIINGTSSRRAVIGFVEPGTPASGAANLSRGMDVLLADGVDVTTANTRDELNILQEAFFPTAVGQNHTFRVRSSVGAERDVTMMTADITHTPVLITDTIDQGGVKVGYILFNDHIATSEAALIDAVTTLKADNIQDLVLDIRYNGGGFLDIANELAFMIAGPARTTDTGQIFERLMFNNKNPTRDPISGQLLSPGTLFHDKALDIAETGDPVAGAPLPHLDLGRLYVITGPNTCSASESIINGLRGVNVQVFLIGSTTCGKPYGFYPQDNCGTTYFSIQFQGVNAMSFGDYPDGFAAWNQTGPNSVELNGCSIADDFLHALGDPAEGRLAATLAFRASGNSNGSCPTASGFAPGAQLKPGQMPLSAADGKMFKNPFRENRILRVH
jgi:C-terminal processing protease CtpA/Prc